MNTNTWYQIHTNGGTTTFARVYEGINDLDASCFYFEKMSVDHTRGYQSESIVEVFGQTEYDSETSAYTRLAKALADDI